MLMRTLFIGSLALTLCLVGCKDDKKEAAPADAPKGGLTSLVKDDVIVGKPNRFNPKMKPIAEGDTIWVIYTGTFKDGAEFDGNDPKTKPDAKPLTFQVGAGGVIKGWEEGVLGMLPGGVRKLSIPWKLGYGEQGRPPKIPPYTDLYFTIQVLEVSKLGEELMYGHFDEKLGTGAAVKDDSKCTVHYQVRGVDGKLVQDTRDTKTMGKPIVFTIGQQEALNTIEDGLKGMKAGGVRELAIPPRIGFMASERTGVDADSFFYVRIELLKVE